MRALARVLVFPLVLIGASWTSSPALASCFWESFGAMADQAEVVVYGTVTETRQTFAPASGVIRFQPLRFLKGTLPGEVEVFLGPTKGGPITSIDYEAVVRGESHTLYLRSAGNGAWQTDVCSGSHVGAPTPDENTFFGTGASAPPPAPMNNTQFVIAAVAIAVIALAAVLVVRRRYSGPSTLTTTSP